MPRPGTRIYVPSLTNKICKVDQSLSTGEQFIIVEIDGVPSKIPLSHIKSSFVADEFNYHRLVGLYPGLENAGYKPILLSEEKLKPVGDGSFYIFKLMATDCEMCVSRTYVDKTGNQSSVSKKMPISISAIRNKNFKVSTPDGKTYVAASEHGFICLVEGYLFDILITNEQDEFYKSLRKANFDKILFKQSIFVPYSVGSENTPNREYTMTIYPNRIVVNQLDVGKIVSSNQKITFNIDFDKFISKGVVHNDKSYVKKSSEGFTIKFNNDFITMPVSLGTVDFLKALAKDFWSKM